MARKHPYQLLPDRQFWRLSVAQKSIFDLNNLYSKKYDILAGDRIATAGSCFAQNIAKRLKKSGYNYVDFEPAPHNFPEDKREEFGYGVYSARYGNIYTAAQLRQLVDRAFGVFVPKHQIVEKDGRYYDLLRPTIEPRGFESKEEAERMISDHLQCVRSLIFGANVLIFTFGLTEAWRDKRDQTVYPVCPGTAAGEYDPEKYEFHNYSFSEIYDDTQHFIKMVRRVNPTVKFLFTVSPVPLVATATDRHVLVATTYSKSVLRAVAGALEASDPDIDYFPSYEVITCSLSRGVFYNPDLRNVNEHGVDEVMRHFFSQHPKLNAAALVGSEIYQEERDPVCEEKLLDEGLAVS